MKNNKEQKKYYVSDYDEYCDKFGKRTTDIVLTLLIGGIFVFGIWVLIYL